jgi:hypothetical protein
MIAEVKRSQVEAERSQVAATAERLPPSYRNRDSNI